MAKPVVKLPPLPVLSVSKIFQLRAKLAEEVLPALHGFNYVGENYEHFVHQIHDAVPTVPFEALHCSLEHLAGQDILDKECKELAWRIAGNLHRLKTGDPVPPYLGQQLFLEWSLLQITEVKPFHHTTTARQGFADVKFRRKLAAVKCFVIAGLPAGQYIEKVMSCDFLYSATIKQKFGFTKFDSAMQNSYSTRASFPLTDPLEYTKMRFYALLDPAVSQHGPSFDLSNIAVTGTLRNFNRELLLKRQRSEFKCPRGYALSTACWACEQGYGACAAACHPTTYVTKECSTCKKSKFFDPAVSSELCVDCTNKQSHT